jgi:translation initiation factor 2 alpha subunit (eIF-2alpha)
LCALQALKFRADVEVHCFGEDGVEAVKAGLRKGKEVGEEGCEVKVSSSVMLNGLARCSSPGQTH